MNKSTKGTKRKTPEDDSSALPKGRVKSADKGKEKEQPIAEHIKEVVDKVFTDRAQPTSPPKKKSKDGFVLELGDISEPTFNPSDLEDFANRFVIRGTQGRSAKSKRWTMHVRAKDPVTGALSQVVLQPIRFELVTPHRLAFQPKRFRAGETEPYSMIVRLAAESCTEDGALLAFLEKLQDLIAKFLCTMSAEERTKIFGALEVEEDSFRDPDFWKGFVSWYEGHGDLKARFEWNTFTKVPTFLCLDLSVKEKPRSFHPSYFQPGDGICGTYTIGGFYVSHMSLDEEVLESGVVLPVRQHLIAGATCAATCVERYTQTQMDEIKPPESDGVSPAVDKAISNGEWKSLKKYSKKN